jgi:predicted  nucleic acid-binding Zn-ribbon protein
MDRLDKIMKIAEELSHTRAQVENTLTALKTQLRYLSNAIDHTLAEIDTQGVDANLGKIVDIEEKSSGISRSVKTLKQQSASLEQALGYIKAAKRLSN